MTSKKFSARRPLTDDEEADIQRTITSDPDNPELTVEQIAGLRPFAEVLPALAESARRGPGRPKLDKTLEPVRYGSIERSWSISALRAPIGENAWRGR